MRKLIVVFLLFLSCAKPPDGEKATVVSATEELAMACDTPPVSGRSCSESPLLGGWIWPKDMFTSFELEALMGKEVAAFDSFVVEENCSIKLDKEIETETSAAVGWISPNKKNSGVVCINITGETKTLIGIGLKKCQYTVTPEVPQKSPHTVAIKCEELNLGSYLNLRSYLE